LFDLFSLAPFISGMGQGRRRKGPRAAEEAGGALLGARLFLEERRKRNRVEIGGVEDDEAASQESRVEADVSGEKMTERELIVASDDAFFGSRLNLIPLEVLNPEAKLFMEGRKLEKYKKSKSLHPKHEVKLRNKKAKQGVKFREATEQKTNTESIKEFVEEMDKTVVREEAPKPAKNIAELRERLAKRIAEQKSKRNRNTEKESREVFDKPKKKQRKEKQRPDEEMKEEEEEEEMNAEENISAEEFQKKQEEELRKKVVESISFGALAVNPEDEPSPKEKKLKVSTSRKNLLNVKKMLKKAEENKAFYEELKRSTNFEDQKKAKDQMWEKIEKKTKGEAVDPDPKHIKKVLKKIEKKKSKSTKAWETRKMQQEEEKHARLEKRDENIAKLQKKRVEKRLKRKGIVLENDSQVSARKKRAGFEGKVSGFLNGKTSKQNSKKS